jgi:hypothetical protein
VTTQQDGNEQKKKSKRKGKELTKRKIYAQCDSKKKRKVYA